MTTAPADAPRHLEYLPLSQIQRAVHNPKRHATDRIAGSIGRFGLGEVPMLDERTGRLVAGHGRYDDLLARHEQGQAPPDGVLVGDDGEWLMPVLRGWRSRSDADAEAYLIASNRTTELGGWDDTELADMLSRIGAAEPELVDVAGYSGTELADLLAAIDSAGGDGEPSDEDDGRSDLLALAGVTIGEPRHQPETGQRWALGPHRLVIADLFTDHALWAPMLDEGTVFLPYPTMLAPFSKKAEQSRVIMVQPDTYIAGHMLDKWLAVTGIKPGLLTGQAGDVLAGPEFSSVPA